MVVGGGGAGGNAGRRLLIPILNITTYGEHNWGSGVGVTYTSCRRGTPELGINLGRIDNHRQKRAPCCTIIPTSFFGIIQKGYHGPVGSMKPDMGDMALGMRLDSIVYSNMEMMRRRFPFALQKS